ncbi:ABC transporter ATP-binding protein [Celeribacter arenosi]|uniref:ABC transporter ATP-binding protein n=1 Tax=Celeribacter arenosi TaxID=792649 RepID=A0ABP7JYG1_9RHOB
MFRYFEKLVDPFAPRPRTKPPATYMAFLREEIAPFRRVVPFLIAAGVLIAAIETGLIFYGGYLIDVMSESGPDTFLSRHGFILLLVALGVVFLRPFAIGVQHLLLEQTLAGNVQEQVRWRAHSWLLGQSSSFFQNDFAGRLSNRVMQLGQATEDSLYMVFEALVFALAYIVVAVVLLAELDLRLAVPLVVWAVVYVLYVRYIARRVAVASEKHSDARSRTTGRIVDAYANIETVKLFSYGGREQRFALTSLRRLRLNLQRFLRLMTELAFGLNALNGLLIVGLVGPAIWLWLDDQMTIGAVAAALTLTNRLNGMSGWIMWIVIRLFEQSGVIREGLRSVAVAQTVTDKEDAKELAVAGGEIRFQNLSHHYGKENGGLDGIDLTIKAGERVGLVGRSGAGKSTLVNLLLRFRDAEEGNILIDGQDISAVTQDSLRRNIGMVTQDSSLLHRSVRANLLYGRPDASEEMMVAAAKQAAAHDFILELRDQNMRVGYDAFVGERGVKLSGGQRQRVAIARVILKDAPILILDEATSALDSEVEAAIQDTLYSVMEGKTVIAIAHRLSTLARMDRIVVLDAGRVIETGSHAELVSQGGLYADLWNRQSGGFLAST